MLFLCPKCNKKLIETEARAICPQGHSYDRSREGYYNLLLSNRSSHGDNRAMILARREFLSRGYYKPLCDALCEQTCELAPEGACVLDAGAGEGYYTSAIETALYSRDGKSNVYAFDISKDAVKEISKKNSRISLAVAGSYHMPFADASIDVLINTFSPLALEESRRVLRSGGLFIMVIPGEEHLYELKSVIYDTPYKNEVADTVLEGFALSRDIPVKYVMDLTSRADIASLFAMTPYAYRTKPEAAARISSLDTLSCTADFRIFVYNKC